MPPPTGPHIFVVDDEEIIATSLAAILRMSGFAATAFTDPRNALSQARSEAPNLLLSDVVMPQMSGIDLAIQIKQHCPNCKVLLFSGQAITSDLLRQARQQGHDFNLLSKPIHPTDLLREISRVTG